MFKEWKKFRGWVVMEYFMKNPQSRIHVKGLSAGLKISPRTSQTYLEEYHKSGILRKEVAGNVHQFSLENGNPLARALKRTYVLSKIMESGFIDDIKGHALAAAIYGSCASGDYAENSDVDILIIADDDISADAVRNLESAVGKEASITRMSVSEWKRKKESREPFAQSVLRNSVVLLGENI